MIPGVITNLGSPMRSRGTSRPAGCNAVRRARNEAALSSRWRARTIRSTQLGCHPGADAVAGDVACIHAGPGRCGLKIAAIESRCNPVEDTWP
jgi:hypothetical protein